MSPNFSVVIPLYNKEGYITRAIRSVLNQTYQHFEIVVVDDGSTDKGPDLVKKMRDPRIRIVRQSNSGVSVARNTGISEATNDLIAFLDSDDEWKSNFLESIASLVEQFPEAGAYGTKYQIKYSKTKIVIPEYEGIPELNGCGLIENFFKSSLVYPVLYSSAIVIKREAFSKVGGFPPGVPMGEDLDMWVRIAIDYPIAYVNRVASTYHRDTGINTSQKSDTYTYYGPAEETIKQALSKGKLVGTKRRYALKYIDTLKMNHAFRLVMCKKYTEAFRVVLRFRTMVRFREKMKILYNCAFRKAI